MPSRPPPCKTAPGIEFTFYLPSVLAFATDDSALVWSQRTAPGAAGTAVAFLDPATGQKLNGPAQVSKVFFCLWHRRFGEVLLEVQSLGAVMASYRALVFNVRNIPCRFNAFSTDPPPTANPARRPLPGRVKSPRNHQSLSLSDGPSISARHQPATHLRRRSAHRNRRNFPHSRRRLGNPPHRRCRCRPPGHPP